MSVAGANRRLLAFGVLGVALAILGGSQARTHATLEPSNGTWWLPLAEQQPAFHGRWLTSSAARFVVDGREQQGAAPIIGIWTMVWLFGVYVVMIALWRERAALFMFGTACAVAWSYSSPLSGEITPWDIPVLLVWTVGAWLFTQRRYGALAVLAVAGVAVKETTLVLALPLLFEVGVPAVERATRLAKAVVAGLAVKLLMSGAVGTWAGGATLRRADTGEWNFASNVRDLVHDWPGNAVFTTAGIVAASLILGRMERAALAIFAVFLGSQFFFGLVHEHRIFLELVPLALLPFAALGDAVSSEPRPSLENRAAGAGGLLRPLDSDGASVGTVEHRRPVHAEAVETR